MAKAATVLVLGLFGALSIMLSAAPQTAHAATSSNLNFQARLLNSAGGVVPDGVYNIDFKIYNADSTTGSVGTCSGTCLWEETRKVFNSQGVTVINGYFSVNLGSVTSFPAINWDQQLWLTMNIGGTTAGASPTWDGEMQNAGHSVALTAIPYSFIAGQLALTSGAHRGTLSFGSVTNDPGITLPNASGTVCLQSASACGFVLGSGTAFLQGGNSFGATGTLGTTDGNGLNLITNSHIVLGLSSTGAATLENFSNSTMAFQVQNASASALFNVNSSDGYIINNGAADAGNEIQNASFESNGTTAATGWYTPSASQVITNDPTNARSGNNELQITGNSNTHEVTTKYFAVHPGDTIYTEAYVKNSGGANGDAGIYLEFSDKDRGSATFSNLDTGLPGTSYVVKSITTTVPASKFFVRMAASVKATATTGTFYFDDFYLKKSNEQAPLSITNVSTTAFTVQNASSQTVLGVDTSTSKIFTTIPDSGSAIGFLLNTPSYTTSGAKLLSIQNNGTPKFSVDKDGNVTTTGGLAISGAISGATTITGSGNFNTTGGALQTNSLNRVDNSGNLTNIGNLTTTGASTFATTGANGFTFKPGTDNAAAFQVQNAASSKAVLTVDTTGNKTILGTGGASGITGTAQFNYSGSSGSITVAPLDPSSTAYTLNLPAENGILCTSAASSTSNCTNFASSSSLTTGLAGKLNKNAADTSAVGVTVGNNLYAFTNNSSAVASGVLKLDNNNNTDNALYVTGTTDYASGKAYILVNNTNGTPSGNLIDLQANAVDKFTVDAAGNIVAAGNISIATGKLYEINGVQITSAALSNNGDIAKLTVVPQTFSNDNTFSSAGNSFTGNGAGLASLNATNVTSGTLTDNRLSANVALLNRAAQTFTGDNTFAPTANNVGTTVKQTSGTATSGSVLDVQTANGSSHFLQITNAAANEGNVTLQSVGATRDLTLDSGSGTIKIGSTATILQKTASAFTIDLSNATASTLNISNSGGSVANLSVTGDISVASGHVYKVGGTSGNTISTCGAGNYVASFASTGGLVTGGSCTAIGTTTLQTAYDNSSSPATITTSSSSKGVLLKAGSGNDSTTLFQVQDSNSKSYILVNSSGASVSIGDTGIASTVQIGNTTGAVAQTVNIGNNTTASSSTNVVIGSTIGGSTTLQSGTTNINSATVATSQSTITLFNTNATNVTAFGAGTTIAIGATTGTITLKNANTVIGNAPGSGTITHNGATLNATLAVLDDSDGGALGGTPGTPLTAAQSVDIYTSISVAQTTAGQTITLPTPTASTTYGRLLYLSNIGTQSFIIGTVSINPGQAGTLVWSNTNGAASWQFAGAGADSIANQSTLDQTANFRINGTGRANTSFTSPVFDSISGALGIGSANATSITLGNAGATPTTAITLQGAASATYTLGTSSNTGSITIGNSTATNTLNFGAATVATGNTQTIHIGDSATGTGKDVITIGNTNGASSLTLSAGTGGISLSGDTTVANDKLLVIGNHTGPNSAGGGGSDLTCTSGGVYYNTTTNRFRGCENGTWINLDSYVDVKSYTTGDNTWTMPQNATLVEVILIGGGGGGGGGGAKNGGAERNGGGGGGGGGENMHTYLASDIASTAHVAIGTGASGGAGSAGASNGSNGSAGNATCFSTTANCTGTIYGQGYGGGGGAGGGGAAPGLGGGGGGGGAGASGSTATTATGANGGTPGTTTANNSGSGGGGGGGGSGTGGAGTNGNPGGAAEYGGGGGGGTGASNQTSGAGGSSLYGAGGGGAGGPINSGNANGIAGAGGVGNSNTPGGGGAIGAAATACNAGGTGSNGGAGSGNLKAGSGGGGGGASGGGGGIGCPGGNGGAPGGGGGGGGSGTASAGAGGNGGAGGAWIISW